jgi:hypothetical protein
MERDREGRREEQSRWEQRRVVLPALSSEGLDG